MGPTWVPRRSRMGTVVWYSVDCPGVVVYFHSGRSQGYEILSTVMPDIAMPTLDSALALAEKVSEVSVSVAETMSTKEVRF